MRSDFDVVHDSSFFTAIHSDTNGHVHANLQHELHTPAGTRVLHRHYSINRGVVFAVQLPRREEPSAGSAQRSAWSTNLGSAPAPAHCQKSIDLLLSLRQLVGVLRHVVCRGHDPAPAAQTRWRGTECTAFSNCGDRTSRHPGRLEGRGRLARMIPSSGVDAALALRILVHARENAEARSVHFVKGPQASPLPAALSPQAGQHEAERGLPDRLSLRCTGRCCIPQHL
eukprot:3081085-Pleurochrysis_carterae.AAC.1